MVLLLLALLQEEPLNDLVVQVLKSYPTDGSHGYYWPRGSDWEGTTQDLVYQGTKVCTGDAKKRSYCCGLTFEVFFKAYEKWCAAKKKEFRIGDLDADGLTEFRLQWYGASRKNPDRKKLCLEAVVTAKLGRAIEKLEDARPGDFVQLWRRDGSGHSVIFVEWVRSGGRITGLQYWSTQGATKGIGYHTEKFGEKKGIDPDHLYIVRVVPR
jgi:hypothetical protein